MGKGAACVIDGRATTDVNVSADENVSGYVRVKVVLGRFVGVEPLGDGVPGSCGTTVVTVIEDV